MATENIICRIWADEESPQGGTHRCHAGICGLDGQHYSRDEITRVLETSRKCDKEGVWLLAACEPYNHVGIACNNCKHKWARPLAKYLKIGQTDAKTH